MNVFIESLNARGASFAGFALPMLLQSAVLIALLFALDFALRKRVRATIRYAVWMLALVKLALPPSLASPTGAAYWLPAETAQSISVPAPAPAVALAQTVVNSPSKPVSTFRRMVSLDSVSPRLTWQARCFVVWLTVALGMGLWVAWRLRVVVVLLRHSAEAPEEVRALLESCRQQLGVKRVIPARCAAIGSPAICGVFRPIILLPPALLENLGASEMRSVLLHELAHYKRGDLWVNHAQILWQILYWYNPLLWLANASIRRAREQAVDEMVLVEMGGEAQAYPTTLLHVARLGLGRPLAALGMLGILEPGRGLTRRILHIMNRPLPHTARIGVRGLAAVLLLALIALPMACRSKAEPAPQPTVTATEQPIPGAAHNELTVTISGEGALTLRNKPVTIDVLQKKLTEAVREKPLTSLMIQADEAAPWTDVVKVLDAARTAHINAVNSTLTKAIPSLPKLVPPFNPLMGSSAYDRGKRAWLRRVQDNPKNATILGDAAAYLLLYDRATAEDLLQKAQLLEPQNPARSEQLGQLYKLEAIGQPGTDLAARALMEFEKAQAQTVPAVPGAPRLADLAQMAIAAGDLEKARTYATELLGPGMRWSGGGNAGRALFYGKIALGRIALREGKLDKAEKCLLEAGMTPGDPALDSFGPNMSLAKELLEKGETNSVLEFFQQCEKFWPQYGGENKMAQWTAQVKEGKTPDFGANLNY